MKSKSPMKPRSLLIACYAATMLAFLIGVVGDAYAQRGGGGGFSRGGPASGGNFSAGAPGQVGVGGGAVGAPGQVGVGGGAAGAPGQVGVGGGPAGQVGVYYGGAVAVLPCSSAKIYVGGVAYYSCGTTYYTQGYSPDGSVVYVQTAPPPGY